MTFEFLAVLPLSDLARRPYRGGAGMSEVKAFLSDTGIGHRRFGAIAAGDPLFVRKLRSGASPRLSTVEQVQAWMRANKSALESAPGAQGQDDGEQPMPDRSSDRDRHEEPAEAPADPPPSNNFPSHGTTVYTKDGPQVILDTREAAALLTLSARTLQRYRLKSGGPRYLQIGGEGAICARRPAGAGADDAPGRNGRRVVSRPERNGPEFRSGPDAPFIRAPALSVCLAGL